MKRLIIYLLISLLLVTYLESCSNSTEAEFKSEQLMVSEWLLTGGKTSDGTEIGFNTKDKYSLIFKDKNTIIGVADCNSYSGKYSLEKNKISTTSLISTEMYCGKDSLISNYFKAIASVKEYAISNKKLKLYYGDNGYLEFDSK